MKKALSLIMAVMMTLSSGISAVYAETEEIPAEETEEASELPQEEVSETVTETEIEEAEEVAEEAEAEVIEAEEIEAETIETEETEEETEEVISEEVEVYPNEATQYTLTLDGNGGKIRGASTQVYTINAGDIVNRNDYPEYKDDTKIFAGWSHSKTGSPEILRSELYQYVVNKNETLYAIYTEYWTVTLDPNGGHIENYAAGEKVTVRVPKSQSIFYYYEAVNSNSSKKFLGWSTSKTGSVTLELWQFSDYVPTGNVTLYAVYKTGFSITIDGNGGYFWGDKDTKKVTFDVYEGDSISRRWSITYASDGKALAGYSDTKNGAVKYTEETFAQIVPTKNMTFYAVWRDAWVLTFNGNGGELDGPGGSSSTIKINVLKGQMMQYFVDGVYPGNTRKVLAGFTRTKGSTKIDLTKDQTYSYKPAKNETFYAVWKDGYFVTLDANGGQYWNGKKTLKVATLPNSYPDVYTNAESPDSSKVLIGYAKSKTATKPDYNVYFENLKVTADMTLYAVYGKKPTQPKLITTYNGAQGIGVNFYASSGATDYALYRKYKGVWSLITIFDANDSTLKKTNGGLMYTDTTVKTKYGEGYIYSVAAIAGFYQTSYDTKGLAAYRLINPKFTSTVAGAGKVTLTWNSVACQGYEVQYATEADAKAGKWTKMPQTTKTTLTVTGLKKGVKYVFRVRCQKTNKARGTTWSEYSPWTSATVK